MMGPFAWYAPYNLLSNIWPFINHFRVPRRLFPFVLMCSSILSSLFLIYLDKIKKSFQYRTFLLILVVLAIFVFQISRSIWLWNHHIFYP